MSLKLSSCKLISLALLHVWPHSLTIVKEEFVKVKALHHVATRTRHEARNTWINQSPKTTSLQF